MKIIGKIFIVLELLFVIGVFTYFLINSPQAIAPTGDIITDNFTFEFKNARELLISTNPEFTNPIILKKDFKINLPPGTYYWKVRGLIRESEVRNFTIKTRAEFILNESKTRYKLTNLGNVILNITEKSHNKTIGELIINVGESKEVEKKNQTSFEGKQK